MRTGITVYRGQPEHIKGSVPEFLDTHRWVLVCSVSTFATKPLEHNDKEIQIRMQCL